MRNKRDLIIENRQKIKITLLYEIILDNKALSLILQQKVLIKSLNEAKKNYRFGKYFKIQKKNI